MKKKILLDAADAMERYADDVSCDGCSICAVSWVVAIGRAHEAFEERPDMRFRPGSLEEAVVAKVAADQVGKLHDEMRGIDDPMKLLEYIGGLVAYAANLLNIEGDDAMRWARDPDQWPDCWFQKAGTSRPGDLSDAAVVLKAMARDGVVWAEDEPLGSSAR